MSKLNTKTASWLFKRLSAMSIDEILFRIFFEIRKAIWRLYIPHYHVDVRNKLVDLQETKPICTIEDNISKLIEEVNSYLSHQWLFFGLKKREEQINWHRDPESRIIAPMAFSFSINHRDERLVGNIKNTWEKNRHHHLTILSQAYYLTGKEMYADEVCSQLELWISQNPYLIGVNWSHPLEHGIRLISWIYIYKYLRKSKSFIKLFGPSGILWKSIYEHQKFIYHTYSRGSSANNHLIGEMAGLYMASVFWPIFKESQKWKNHSIKVLEKELIRQNYPDGINREMGFSYQIFVAQFAVLCLIENRKDFTKPFQEITLKMLKFIEISRSILGHFPNYGDSDEGMALQIDPYVKGQLNWLMNQGKELFKEGLNVENQSEFLSKEAGIYFKRLQMNHQSVSFAFDFGPLGMGSMAAHGHADALSFTLSINGKMFFIDPGTYCYHDNLEFREYFRSTRAHNTLLINGEDQATQQGPFLWSDHFESNLKKYDPDENVIAASHTGYSEWNIIHNREIKFNCDNILIEDQISGNDDAQVRISFHLAPEVEITSQNEDSINLKMENTEVILEFNPILKLEILKGDRTGGWCSPSFGIKYPTNTIVLSQVLSLPTTLISVIKIV